MSSNIRTVASIMGYGGYIAKRYCTIPPTTCSQYDNAHCAMAENVKIREICTMEYELVH
jgi:hypothetical protein